MKSLYDISDKITEEAYRSDGRMHYSTLAKFSRTGFNGIPTLFDKIETPSLLLGSMVDCILTAGQEEYNNTYLPAEFPNLDAGDMNLIKGIFNVYRSDYTALDDIPDEILATILDSSGLYTKYKKTESKAKKLREIGSDYYKLLYLADNKILVTNEMHADAIRMAEALRVASCTANLFAPNNPFEPEIERLYQLKFHMCIDGIEYSCMLDEVYVNHKDKIIIPIDLKTSSHTEADFFKSFIDWSYHIQGRQYYRILDYNCKQDDYFKDFKIMNYHFVVVNKKTLNPLVWEFEDTKTYGTLYYGKNNQIECKDPFDLAKELKYYLDHTPSVPVGINLNKPNSLSTWLKTI